MSDRTRVPSPSLLWFTSSYSGNEGGQCVEVALEWRASVHSDNEGGQCVEVALPWHTSSYSDNEGGDCVEVAECPGTVHVRDSKHRSGGRLGLPSTAWSAFLGYVAPRP
ncbi:DUF397 domain-containing protein [Streptomyces alkaliphilus]|uniref:DUF397 domain-containing protein n=1 Tax=Streptomyces alkaliphilus TaxID=1472722 RepID=UPI00117EE63D|nr:DUF397 domain-containing protein [Streptomyces alkaliphilus]MQS09748.1 DUF397 domain-containing protein [Streptomyces alkaliphilus]